MEFHRIWEEEEESGGNGCDCVVCIHSQDNIGTFLSSNGSVPIPPYLNREAVEEDKERYNNVYAKDGGSVAAPTAGLHFTSDVLNELGDSVSSLTLHVGAGTFMPGEILSTHRSKVTTLLLTFTSICTIEKFFQRMQEITPCTQNTSMSMSVNSEVL